MKLNWSSNKLEKFSIVLIFIVVLAAPFVYAIYFAKTEKSF